MSAIRNYRGRIDQKLDYDGLMMIKVERSK